MKIIFWLSLLGILYTYVGYPLIMWMLASVRSRPWKRAPITPSVSIVLAVRNGMSLLPSQIQHLLSLDYANLKEIVIVSDGSTDGTAELLAGQLDPRIHAIILENHSGKAAAVNAGMAQATADIIVLADARPRIAQGAIQEMVACFADEEVGCVSGTLEISHEGNDAASGAVGGFYWRYERWIRTCEATSASPVGVCGCFYAIRRELAVSQPTGIILDDMFQPLSIIRKGYRSVVAPLAFVYDTTTAKVEGEFHRKVRTLAGNFQLFQLAPWLLTPKNPALFRLVSHKVMRLVVPFLLIALLGSSIALAASSRLYGVFAALQILAWIIAIIGLRYEIPVLQRVAGPASALLMLNAAAVVGLYKFLFTRDLSQLWNTGKTSQTAAAAVAFDATEDTCHDSPRRKAAKQP